MRSTVSNITEAITKTLKKKALSFKKLGEGSDNEGDYIVLEIQLAKDSYISITVKESKDTVDFFPEEYEDDFDDCDDSLVHCGDWADR